MFVEAYIYRIFSDNDNLSYIGSTVKNIQQRLEEHEISYGIWILRKFQIGYISSFEVLKNKNYRIEQISKIEVFFDGEKYHKDELFKLEKFYINQYQCVNIHLNKIKNKTKRKDKFIIHSCLDLEYFINKANLYKSISKEKCLSQKGFIKYKEYQEYMENNKSIDQTLH